MWLKMYVGKILVAKSEIEFTEMESIQEKMIHTERMANEMKEEAEFFIDRVPSKMNDEDFEPVLTEEEMSKFRKAVAKQFMRKVA